MRTYLHIFFLGLARMVKPRPPTRDNRWVKAAVMAYKHPNLVKRLVEKLEIPKEKAEAAFEGMKMFLFLAGTKKGGVSLSPQSELVDEAWHNFMLFSQDYRSFCLNHFGHFIHHQPFTEEEQALNRGDGMKNTKSRLLREFGVKVSSKEAGRCDECKPCAPGSNCDCSGYSPAEEVVTSIKASCEGVPSGECSGTTNCSSDCKDG